MIIEVSEYCDTGRKLNVPIQNIKYFYKNNFWKDGSGKMIVATTIVFFSGDQDLLVCESANQVQELICKAHAKNNSQ